MIKKILFVLAALLQTFVAHPTNLAFTTATYSSFNKEMTFERLEGTSSVCVLVRVELKIQYLIVLHTAVDEEETPLVLTAKQVFQSFISPRSRERKVAQIFMTVQFTGFTPPVEYDTILNLTRGLRLAN